MTADDCFPWQLKKANVGSVARSKLTRKLEKKPRSSYVGKEELSGTQQSASQNRQHEYEEAEGAHVSGSQPQKCEHRALCKWLDKQMDPGGESEQLGRHEGVSKERDV